MTTEKDMRVLFMGTPDIAAACLSELASQGFRLVGALTGPDRPVGRGMVMTPPAVKRAALSLGIPVYQPETLKDGAIADVLEKTAPDVIAVVAYGKILPSYVLSYPKYGCVNLHVSLLPRHRGAAPMQRAIMMGDRETGVTVMQMDEGLDTGDILLQEKFPIAEEDTFETVHDTSAAVGAKLLCEALRGLRDGTVTPKKQPAEGVSYAEKITKEDQRLDFTKSAERLHAEIRGLSPIPLAFTRTPDGKLLKVVSAKRAEGRGEAGEVLRLDDKGEGGILVACGEGALLLTCVIPEGKGKMSAADMIRGRKIKVGDKLSV